MQARCKATGGPFQFHFLREYTKCKQDAMRLPRSLTPSRTPTTPLPHHRFSAATAPSPRSLRHHGFPIATTSTCKLALVRRQGLSRHRSPAQRLRMAILRWLPQIWPQGPRLR